MAWGLGLAQLGGARGMAEARRAVARGPLQHRMREDERAHHHVVELRDELERQRVHEHVYRRLGKVDQAEHLV